MSGIKWVTASRMAAQALTWANTFFVIRILSPAEFGLAALAGLFATFLSLISELGFGVALVQRQTRDEETLRSIFGALLLMGVFLMTGLIAAAPLIGALVRQPAVVPLLRLVAVEFLAASVGVIPQARLSMDMRFKELAISQVTASLVGAAATLISAIEGAGAWSLIIGIVVVNVARSSLFNWFFPWIVRPRLQLAKIRQFSTFSGLVLTERSLWYWYMQIDSLVVGRVLGAADLGLYSVARQVTSIPLERAMEVINAVTLPAYSRLKSDLEQLRRAYLKVLRLGAGYAFPVFWGLALVCGPAIRLIIGEKWMRSVPLIQILCISMPLRMLNSFSSVAATSVARQDVNIISLLFAILVIPTGVVIGSRWGVAGIAYAWAMGFPLVYAFNMALMRRALGVSVSELARAVLPAAGAAGTMALALYVLTGAVLRTSAPVVHLVVSIPAGVLIFASALWLISRRHAEEFLGFARAIFARKGIAEARGTVTGGGPS